MKGWRTLAFNGGGFLVTLLLAPEIQAVIPADYLPWCVAAAFVVNIGLRFVTTTPVGKSE